MTYRHLTAAYVAGTLLLGSLVAQPPSPPAFPTMAGVRLPVSKTATDPAPDRDRIHLAIVGPRTENQAVERPPYALPIVLDGQPVADFATLRRRLRELADPRRFPDSAVDMGLGVYASAKTLVIHCDREQDFDWVLGCLQTSSMTPGMPMDRVRDECPLIHRVELAVAGGRVLVVDLPTDIGLAGLGQVAPTTVKLALQVSKEHRELPSHERPVGIRLMDEKQDAGRLLGLEPKDGQPPWEPSTLGETVVAALRAEQKLCPRMDAHVHPFVPTQHAVTALDLGREAGFSKISFSGVPHTILTDLERRGR